MLLKSCFEPKVCNFTFAKNAVASRVHSGQGNALQIDLIIINN